MSAYPSYHDQVRAVRATRERVAALLSRYPHISQSDREEILSFMKNGRQLDIGMLTANDNLRPQFDAFMQDHKSHFRIDAVEVVRALALIVAVLAVCWWLFHLVRPAQL